MTQNKNAKPYETAVKRDKIDGRKEHRMNQITDERWGGSVRDKCVGLSVEVDGKTANG